MSMRQEAPNITYSDRYIVSVGDEDFKDEAFWRRSLRNAYETEALNNDLNSNSMPRSLPKKSFGIDYDCVLQDVLGASSLRFQPSRKSEGRIRHLSNRLDRYIAGRQQDIETEPVSILDAPGLRDDFYLNILDWSQKDSLAIALDDTVYLWMASTGTVEAVCQVNGRNDYIASVAFSTEGDQLVCGNSKGCLTITDLATQTSIQDYHIRETGRIATVATCPVDASVVDQCVSVGARTGKVYHFDRRCCDRPAAVMNGHTLEVCGLKRSSNGYCLASGGNDNQVCIWDLRWPSEYLWCQDCHGAAVKALAWCPWSPNLLATGGGTADRRIRFWNTQTNTCIKEVQTDSQVCGLIWSPNGREIVSTHGFISNELAIWHYPSMRKIEGIRAHESRVLHSVLSKDGRQVVTAAANEHLKFWNIFPVDSCLED